MWGCSARCGASCTRSGAWPTWCRRRSPPSRPGSPRRWSPPRSACSPRYPRWSPTTASPTTSTGSRCASRASWRSFPTSCSGSRRRSPPSGTKLGPEAVRSRRLMNQINVVPYVDVMLVLLVIFMVTAPLVNPGVIDLPSVGKSSQPPAAPLEVIVRRDQSLMLRERDKGAADERAVSTAQLVAALREKQRKNRDQPVVISADKDVRYEAVLKVMDELQRQNIRRVGLLVKPATP